MALVKAPLKTKYDGKIEHLRTHILEFTRRIQNTGLYHEFAVRTHENPRPIEIPEEQWTLETTDSAGKQSSSSRTSVI